MEKWKIPILQLQDWDSGCDFAINAASKWGNGEMENPNLACAQSCRNRGKPNFRRTTYIYRIRAAYIEPERQLA
jgi:hypothetical protein